MKKFLTIFLTLILFNGNVYAAGGSSSGADSSGGGAEGNTQMYNSAVSYVKAGKKLEKKNKLDKANKKYQKAFNRLTKLNKKDPSNPDIFNYLGFTSRKLGDFENAEIYYLKGLKISPKHNGINEYLGELYLSTNRPEKAKERLKVLEGCNCEEFEDLQTAINQGSSKY